jgi:hypothetical protein
MTQAGRWRACRFGLLVVLGACGLNRPDHTVSDAPPGGIDVAIDSSEISIDAYVIDGQITDAYVPDAYVPDAYVPDAYVPDAYVPDAYVPDAPTGVLNGGPCLSGTAGATAYRIRWAGNGSGSTAYVVYEVNGLPDHSRDHAAAYGYQIGYTPRFEDVFLAQGGLRLDGSGFVDIELTTAGISQITNATLSIYGRSFNTTTSGSFHWQTFDGTGAAPTNLVSNSAPYEWYSADMTSEISAGDSGVLLRIKAGPSSGVLVVNRIEICMTAT